MAKVYRITLDKSDAKPEGSELTLREAEISVMTQIFEAAGTVVPKISEFNQIVKVIEMLDELPKTTMSVTFTKAELDLLEKGLKVTADKDIRMKGWFRCKNLFAQIEHPKEEDVK